ncbi:N2227-like protein-domain-containing protein [Tricladium varicosporioides]|nr:N2227-like protein-domain-containing protein [Hymenoscyphus varicosporioides]
MSPTTPDTEFSKDLQIPDEEERRVLLGALASFYQYSKVAHFNTTHLRRQSFYALPGAHWELLAKPPFSYLETLDKVDMAIDENAELAGAILQSGLHSFGLSLPTPSAASVMNDWRATASSNDLEKARSTLRQFFRDWSEEGRAEREACYGPVIKVLRTESSLYPRKMRVLVPGAGLGRLVFDLCCAGFDSEGNEISYHQLLASSYILNHCSESRMHTLYPWVHSFSNHKNRESHLRSVQIPDVCPGSTLGAVENPGEMSMSASDFLLLYGSEDQKDAFDAVATVFFLDTAPNVIRYIEAIKNCLRKGGLFINVGPLLWHFENNAPGSRRKEKDSTSQASTMGIADPGSVELTDDEVVALVETLGFVIESRDSGISAPYIQDIDSMLQNTYKASHWVARKK